MAAVLSALLAVAATAAWARDGHLGDRGSLGDGTAVAGPSATEPATLLDSATGSAPVTLGSEEADPGVTASPATAASVPEVTQATGTTDRQTPATQTPVTPTHTTADPTGGTEPVDGTDPPPPAQITVPDVANRSQAEATATLSGAGLGVDPATVAVTSCTIGSGKVVKTNPAAGAKAAEGTKVKLTVSSGAPTAKVPATVGKTEQDAKTALGNAGFSATVTAVFLPKGNADIGRVTAQSVTAGTTTSTCSAVVLTVGRQQLSIVTPGTPSTTEGPKLAGP